MTKAFVHRVCVALILCVGSFGVLSPRVAADPAEGGAGKPPPDVSVGQAAYQQHCARCHGITAKGDGRDAKRLYPRPRDLTEGVFKFRSTASGTPPTDDDLFATLTNGLPGSGMSDWRQLDDSLRWQLVYYIKSLSPTFEETPPQPVSLGEDPGIQHVDLERGKQVYEKLGCAACHGSSGRANGPSAATLVDNWGRPTRPVDLTQGWTYRGGSDPRAVVTRLLTGVDGTPMPSYAEAVSTEEAWQLASYVRSLQHEPRWTMIARVPYLADGLPDSPTDPRWTRAERVAVRLQNVVDVGGSLNAPQTVTSVWFQAVYHEEAISFKIFWHDPSEDRLPAKMSEGQAGSDPADAMALVLRPVDVAGDVVSLQAWPLRDSPSLDLCVWSANRPQAHEAIADRFEAVLQGLLQGIPLESQAVYEDGQWTLLLTRPLAPQGLDRATHFAPKDFVPIAFAVWDGGNPGQRAVSTWIDLVLQPPPVSEPAQASPWIYVVWAISGLVLIVGLVLALKKRKGNE